MVEFLVEALMGQFKREVKETQENNRADTSCNNQRDIPGTNIKPYEFHRGYDKAKKARAEMERLKKLEKGLEDSNLSSENTRGDITSSLVFQKEEAEKGEAVVRAAFYNWLNAKLFKAFEGDTQ